MLGHLIQWLRTQVVSVKISLGLRLLKGKVEIDPNVCLELDGHRYCLNRDGDEYCKRCGLYAPLIND